MNKLLSLIPARWKWAALGIAAVALLGGASWVIRDWRAGAVKVVALERDLQEERDTRAALDKQYRAQIQALANERLEAQSRALALDAIENEVNENAKDNDRPVGPVLQRYLERLHSTLEGTGAAENGHAAAARNPDLQTPGHSRTATGNVGKSIRPASQ